MDALSRLLTLYPMRTALDIHCQVGAPWSIDYTPVPLGTAPYHMIVGGSAWLDAEGEQGVELSAGDVIVMPKGGWHRLHVGDIALASPARARPGVAMLQRYSNASPGAVTDMLCGEFIFQDGAASALLAALPDVMVIRTGGRADCSNLLTLIHMLKSETDAIRPGASAVVAQLSSALFALLLRAWLDQAHSTPGLFALLAERRLQPALHGMLEAPGKAWSLNDMAEACHMSRATFARLFHQIAGDTPAAVLTQTRMAHAAHALAQSGRAVAAIGETVGYQSEAAFNRVFKRSFGVGPGEYRRNARSTGDIGP